MRVEKHVIASLFNGKAPPISQPAKSANCREAASANERAIGSAIAKFGHLRVSELARCVWPHARYGEQMALRTLKRMTGDGRLIGRQNALGGRSYVLTRRGASWLELYGIPARQTLELTSVSGSTFSHRTIATRFLIERQISGNQVAGEYEISGRTLPFAIESVFKTLQKKPDGIVWRSTGKGDLLVELVEVENAAKPLAQIVKVLEAAEYAGQEFDARKKGRLAGLIIVFNSSQDHLSRICKAAEVRWGHLSNESKARFTNAVRLVMADLAVPLVWHGSRETTLREALLKRVLATRK